MLMLAVFACSSHTPSTSQEWLQAGMKHYKAGRKDEALQALDRAIQMNPREAETWYQKGHRAERVGTNAGGAECL